MNIREFVNEFIAITGYRLIATENYNALSHDPHYRAGKNWSHPKVPQELRDFVFKNLQYSNGQIQQDLLASWLSSKLRTGNLNALTPPQSILWNSAQQTDIDFQTLSFWKNSKIG
jgi:hypothetical protein